MGVAMLAGHAAACAVVVVVLGTVVVVGTIGVRDVVVVVCWSRVSTMATAMHAVGRSHLRQEKKRVTLTFIEELEKNSFERKAVGGG